MAFMRIHCDYCKGHWEVYERDQFNDEAARTCPHCFSRIDEQTWSRQILPGFGQIADANRELFKDHTGYHYPLFSVDVIADSIFTDEEMKNKVTLIFTDNYRRTVSPMEAERACSDPLIAGRIIDTLTDDEELQHHLRQLIDELEE